MFQSDFYRRYLLPGFVFQSVVIAGGYGTGRELAEFFLGYGPWGGLAAMLLISMPLWSLVAAATFEFARVHQVSEYRGFFRALLGRGWFLFEICYLILLLLVLAVIASAAATILQEAVGLNYLLGTLFMTALVGLLVFFGSRAIEGVLSFWSLVLYAVYIVFFIACLSSFGPAVRDAFAQEPIGGGWALGGLKYAAYNLGTIPAVLFAIRHCKTRRQAVCSGLLAGPIAMLPAFFFFFCMVARYPAILEQAVPATFLLDLLGIGWLKVLFQVVLFGTLIETGAGMIHAVNERTASWFSESGRSMPPWLRPALATAFLLVGAAIAHAGLITLIARGYGTITWGFMVLFVVPVLTLGLWKIRLRSQA